MLLLKLLHLLCWVYWLGADVGTFYAARFVANGRLTAAQRATAAQIMLGIDLAPRVCMPLTLATGVHLAVLAAGWGLATVTLVAIWAVCLAWLAVALWLHHKLRSARALVVARADFIWRGLLAAALTITAAAGLLGSWPALAPWLAFKLLCFALCVVCGLAIRLHLKGFATAFGALQQDGATAAGNAAIAQGISRCVPYVIAIWLLLLLSAATGLHLITF